MPRTLDRRDHAAQLFAGGLRQAEVARALGISRSTACEWHRRWLAAGRGGLDPARRGPAPKLAEEGAAFILDAILEPPRAAGIDLDEWSLALVALLIERRTGVRYHRRHVGRLLRRIGVILPPFGAHAGEAMGSRTAADPDGIPLRFIRRRG